MNNSKHVGPPFERR